MATALLASAAVDVTAAPLGYYREPAIHGRTIVFVAEGDLWRVDASGGRATRLTSHPGDESTPALSPDGRTVAFIGHYEGPAEVYTMPLTGGLPVRRTWGIDSARVVGWTPDGEVLCSTRRYSTLPSWQLVRLAVERDDLTERHRIPLAQAADGSYDASGRTLFFTRLAFQGSHTKRYKGGTAQSIWKFADGATEAGPLTPDWPGTSKRPMAWRGRVYFASDRDDTMNLWSMNENGGDLRQHTRHAGWDVQSPCLEDGRIVYQLGADLHVYDIAADRDMSLAITLDSDLDQTRENWIDEPNDWISAVHLSPDGDRVALTARGRVFVAPHRQGRLVEVTREEGVRYRDARFLPDGESLVALSDASGEVEMWNLPANGVGAPEQWTSDGEVLRWEGIPSPDGRWVAHHDKNQRLFVFDVEQRRSREIDRSSIDQFQDLTWSPDSRWLAYVAWGDNLLKRIRLYGVEDGTTVDATSDRFDSFAPAWSRDGEWLYLLSDRNLKSIVQSTWGSYQPEPFLDRKTGIFMLALTKGLRSPFAPKDELNADDDADEEPDDAKRADDAAPEDGGPPEGPPENRDEGENAPVRVEIDRDGLAARLQQVPVPPGNYRALAAGEDSLFWTQRTAGDDDRTLAGAPIRRLDVEVETIAEAIDGYELSADGRKLLLRQKKKLYIVDAKAAKAELDDKAMVDLSGWTLSVRPRDEWRQMFVDAWRLERDYFYDLDMHGVDWDAMRARYEPLVDRVTTRSELSDLLAQMVSELSALHTFVAGGDRREAERQAAPSSLGAWLVRDVERSGYRVERVLRSDSDEVDLCSPLARPEVDVGAGDVILQVDGADTLGVPDIGQLLRNRAGRQVLLRVLPAEGGATRDVIVHPLTLAEDRNLRYHEWEYTRRLAVEAGGDGRIGYVHLRAMTARNFTEWAKGFYPVFNRQGLIIDVRNNRGGNIDSWILGRLLRRAWFYWSQRIGQAPTWNMQFAFRGHIAVLCNETTASDGEAFTEGIKRLDLGRVFGTRTWGGEIWLTSSNRLVDRGIATAAEYGVFGPEGEWLIEGHGVDPDTVVDNLPHATFLGRDAQLEAAIDYLNDRIAAEPVPAPTAPPHPRP